MARIECVFPDDKFAAGALKEWCDAQAAKGLDVKIDSDACKLLPSSLLAANNEGSTADKPKDGTLFSDFIKACHARKDKHGNNATLPGAMTTFFKSSTCGAEIFTWLGNIPSYVNGSCESCTAPHLYTGNKMMAGVYAAYYAAMGCCSSSWPKCKASFSETDGSQNCWLMHGLQLTTCATMENFSTGLSGTCPAVKKCVPFVMQVGDGKNCEECATWPCTWQPCSDDHGREVCSSSS